MIDAASRNPEGTSVTRIERRHLNGAMYLRQWIGKSVGPWHPFQGFSGKWNHTDPLGWPIIC